MTIPARHLDEHRLSELVDGAGSGADREHVEGCTECRARLGEMQDVIRMVASAPAVSEAKREEAVQAALAEFNHVQEAGASGQLPGVADLDAHRAKRRRLMGIRSAAAAAALVTIGGVSALVAETGSGTRHVASKTAASVPRATAGSGSVTGGSGQSGSAGSAVSQLPDLGSIGGDAQLIGALKASSPSPPSAEPFASSQQAQSAKNASCQAPAVSNGSPVLVATLTWKGTPALAFVYSTQQRRTAIVESSATCKVLATVTY